MSASLRSAASYNVVKRIHSPLDHLVMQSVDNSQVMSRVTALDTCVISWLFPVNVLQSFTHPRFEVESVAETPETGPLGILTLCASRNAVCEPSAFERMLEKPQASVSLRTTVIDRVHWQRTLWAIRSYSNSARWARIPRRIWGLDIDDRSAVSIETDFDEEKQKYNKYSLRMPSHDLKIDLEDTGVSVLDPSVPVVPGFADNESALKIIAMGRESNTRGEGGMVYRQPYFASPVLPNVAKMMEITEIDEFLMHEARQAPLGPPVAAWMIREIPEIKLYEVEAHIEDENEPHSGSHFGEKSLLNRVQRKAMNRYNSFRDEVRDKAYSDIEGRETPR